MKSKEPVARIAMINPYRRKNKEKGQMKMQRDAGRTACWVAASCLILTMFLPLTAYAAERVVLAEYFTATW